MVVFATPLYYHGMSAQLKLVVDRFAPITAASIADISSQLYLQSPGVIVIIWQ